MRVVAWACSPPFRAVCSGSRTRGALQAVTRFSIHKSPTFYPARGCLAVSPLPSSLCITSKRSIQCLGGRCTGFYCPRPRSMPGAVDLRAAGTPLRGWGTQGTAQFGNWASIWGRCPRWFFLSARVSNAEFKLRVPGQFHLLGSLCLDD
jgi:hypothetical protein